MKNPFLFFSRARDKPRKRASPWDSVSAALAFYFGASAAGKSVTPRSALQMSTVYACVRVIAETIASLPLHVYERTDTGSVKAYEHPLYFLLHDEPNSEMTSFVLRETLLSHLLLWGNAYCQILRNGRGHILGLYPLLPVGMTVDRFVSDVESSSVRQPLQFTPDGIPGKGGNSLVIVQKVRSQLP